MIRRFLIYMTILAGFCLSGCESAAKPPPETAAASEAEMTMTINGFEARVTSFGEPEYILKADRARILEKQNVVRMNGIDLVFFITPGEDEKEKKESRENAESGQLSAKRGVYYFRDSPEDLRKKNDIDLEGDVLLEKDDGTMLKTPKLHYESAAEKIYSNAGFEKKIVSEGRSYVSTGKSFVTDKNMRHWEQTGGGWTSQSVEEGEKKE